MTLSRRGPQALADRCKNGPEGSGGPEKKEEGRSKVESGRNPPCFFRPSRAAAVLVWRGPAKGGPGQSAARSPPVHAWGHTRSARGQIPGQRAVNTRSAPGQTPGCSARSVSGLPRSVSGFRWNRMRAMAAAVLGSRLMRHQPAVCVCVGCVMRLGRLQLSRSAQSAQNEGSKCHWPKLAGHGVNK